MHVNDLSHIGVETRKFQIMKNMSEMFKYYLTKYLYCEICSILIVLVGALKNIFDITIC